MFEAIFKQFKEKRPLVHCITNYVTVNDCANALLAAGASPVMADDEREVEDIVSIADALCLNIGTLNERTVRSMLRAGRRANALGKPVVLDPVGCGASRLRTETSLKLLKEIKITLVRANMSEMRALAGESAHTKGVDADARDGADAAFIKNLSLRLGVMLCATGEKDIVTDGIRTHIITGGHEYMAKVSGTGCMLSALSAAYAAVSPAGPVLAAAAFGLCGEMGYKEGLGASSYRAAIIDQLSLMDEHKFKEFKIDVY